ncbi:6PGL phosphogluconolactonase, partial [Galbula dea]|nr:6PGL phosphogluconolactonase [Galbula dea]
PALAQLIAEQAAAAGGRFSLGLSGGSLIGLLARDLPPAVASTGPAAPARWVLAFCDERLVPHQHPESIVGAYEVRRGWGGGALTAPVPSRSFPFLP